MEYIIVLNLALIYRYMYALRVFSFCFDVERRSAVPLHGLWCSLELSALKANIPA